MEEQKISFETAKLAKEKGFDELISWYYYPEAFNISGKPRLIADGAGENINTTYYDGINDNNSLNLFKANSHHPGSIFISAPRQSLLQKWLRDIYGINIIIEPSFNCYNITKICQYDKTEDQNDDFVLDGLEFKDFNNYEEAMEKGLEVALKTIKDETVL